MNPRSIAGSALIKLLILGCLLICVVLFWNWKNSHGIIGQGVPIKFDTRDTIAFLRSLPDKSYQVVVVKSDGTDEKVLATDQWAKQGLTWDPAGKQICFSAEVKEETAPAYQLFILGRDGARQLTYGTGSKHQPSWSSTDKRIVFMVGGAIKSVNENGEGTLQMYPSPHAGHADEEGEEQHKNPPVNAFALSPVGQAFAAIQVTEGETLPVQGQSNWWQKKDEAVKSSEPQYANEPETMLILLGPEVPPILRVETNSPKVGMAWHPDGKHIITTSTASGKTHMLASFIADEPKIAPIALLVCENNTLSPENPAVSPDGKSVAVELWKLIGEETREIIGIAVFPIDPNSAKRVTNRSEAAAIVPKIRGKATQPRWSPDGKRILYSVADSAGRHDIWVANADGSSPVNITKGKGDNFDAAWSPAK